MNTAVGVSNSMLWRRIMTILAESDASVSTSAPAWQHCSIVFTPVHTKNFNLDDTLPVGVNRIQRNLESMQRQVESWHQTQITDEVNPQNNEGKYLEI